MRVVAFAAAALLFSAADSALAMSFFSGNGGCAKGMLWPYVRNPGDCLTDAEIQAGQRGVYTGPVNTNPNLGAIAPPPPPQPAAPAAAIPAYAPPPGAAYVAQPQAPAYAAPPGYAAAPGMVPQPMVPQPQAIPPQGVPVAYGPPPPGVADPNIQTVTKFSCSKGALWPFMRKLGDCLTTDEKKKGQTGVYGGGSGLTVTQVSVATGAPAFQPAPGSYIVDGTGQVVAVQPAAPSSYAVDSNGQVVAVAPPAAAASCSKGALWPFVRKAGDCPTSAEQKRK